jgi:hypothetical protein
MKLATPLETPQIPSGIACPRCSATTFKTSWQRFADGSQHVRMTCGACGAFIRWLKQRGSHEPRFEPARVDTSAVALAAPPSTWHWLGLIRQADRVWRPVALAGNLAACWEALLTFPGEGDRLVVPTQPIIRAQGQEVGEPETPGSTRGAAFLGWARRDRSHTWRAVTTGATWEECWDALLNRRDCGSERLVLESGRYPDNHTGREGGQ